MRTKSFLQTLVIVVLAAGAGSLLQVAHAQTSPASQPPIADIQADIKRQLEYAQRAGVSLSQQQVQEIMQHAESVQRSASQAAAELDLQVSPQQYGGFATPLPTPLSHLIGKDGIPFPAFEELILKPIPTPSGPTPTPEPVWSPEPYRPPRRCEINETKRVVFKQGEKETEVLNDHLFVAEELVPTDPEEAFGNSPLLIVPYRFPIAEGTLIRMSIYDVPCVPYRIRLTNVAEYFDSGLNALRNYDGDPAGKGKLSPLIKQKLDGQKPQKPQRRR